jgi:hypothetical protein
LGSNPPGEGRPRPMARRARLIVLSPRLASRL